MEFYIYGLIIITNAEDHNNSTTTIDIMMLNSNTTTLSPSTYPPQPLVHASQIGVGITIILCLFFLAFATICSIRNQLNPPAMNTISTTDINVILQQQPDTIMSIEDRKYNFDHLPKIHYHHNSCTLSKRRLMTEYPTIEFEEDNSSSVSETATVPILIDDHQNDVEIPILRNESDDDIEEMIRHSDIQQKHHPTETIPTEIRNNDIENNVQVSEVGDIINNDTSKDDLLRSSLKRLSSIYSNTSSNNTTNNNTKRNYYDSDEDLNNYYYHEECPICFDGYEPDEIVILLPECRHMYHISCLEQWFIQKQSNVCPLCKTPIIITTIDNNIESSTSSTT